MSYKNNNTVNQGDKPILIEGILKYYRAGWSEYDVSTLREQIEDIKISLSKEKINKLNKDQLINILIAEDATELNNKSYYELNQEYLEYKTVTY